MSKKDRIERYRFFLKDTIRGLIDFSTTDQARGKPPPPLQKPVPDGARLVDLPSPDSVASLASLPLADAIGRRESRRRFSDAALSQDELSLLLWAMQGVRRVVGEAVTLRTVPSAGARHPLETYVCLQRVEGLEPGIYRYLPIQHQLVFERPDAELAGKLGPSTLGQTFAADAAVVFVWTSLPYRTEWRYDLAAHKVIAIDAGHVAQNLYLACEAIEAGTCAIAAYDQAMMDALVGVEGEDEFVVYLAPVGKR